MRAGPILLASADFVEAGLTQSHDVSGHLTPFGNFIFRWEDGGLGKMVLADKTGNELQSGFTNLSAAGWRDEATWQQEDYQISNFREGMCL